MGNKVNRSIRIDADIWSKGTAILEDLGMSLSTATEIFLRQVISHNGIPFEIKRCDNFLELKEKYGLEEDVDGMMDGEEPESIGYVDFDDE